MSTAIMKKASKSNRLRPNSWARVLFLKVSFQHVNEESYNRMNEARQRERFLRYCFSSWMRHIKFNKIWNFSFTPALSLPLSLSLARYRAEHLPSRAQCESHFESLLLRGAWHLIIMHPSCFIHIKKYVCICESVCVCVCVFRARLKWMSCMWS